MADKIKATLTLAKLYESQGLIADAIATYEAIYEISPSEDLFQRIESLRHDFITSGIKTKKDNSPISIIFSTHEKELFRILTTSQYKKFTDAYNPDNSELNIVIDIEEDEDDTQEIIELDDNNSIKVGSRITKKTDEVFQEVLDNIGEEDIQKSKIASTPREMHPSAEDILKQNLTIRDLLTHLKRIYGEDTLLKSIDRKELLESITSLL